LRHFHCRAGHLAYNAAGQFTGIDRYADPAATNLVVGTSYSYDELGRLVNLRHADAADATLTGYTWTFDAFSRVTQFVSSTDGTSNYSYDNTSTCLAPWETCSPKPIPWGGSRPTNMTPLAT
jgi:hypothetical protein